MQDEHAGKNKRKRSLTKERRAKKKVNEKNMQEKNFLLLYVLTAMMFNYYFCSVLLIWFSFNTEVNSHAVQSVICGFPTFIYLMQCFLQKKERIKRAEKNRELGVKRLKLPTVLKPKKIVHCRHYLQGRCHEVCLRSGTILLSILPCWIIA